MPRGDFSWATMRNLALTIVVLSLAALLLSSCRARHSATPVDSRGTYVVSCRRTIDCIRDASYVCPYGYRTLSSDRYTDGASASSVGSTVFVQSYSTGENVIRCKGPVFCTKQSDCAGLELSCVRSERFPGRAVCADR